jgi:hypothetical protein
VIPHGLAAIARYGRAIGVEKALVLPRDAFLAARPRVR